MRRQKGGVVLADGPAAGRYDVRRTPHFLRAVVARSDGHADLLDQLHDQPRPIEAVHVYELDTAEPWFDPESFERSTRAIICPPPGASGTYRHRADVDGEQLRETDAWRTWCRAQPAAGATRDRLAIAFAEAGAR